jgi:hypothetical protein
MTNEDFIEFIKELGFSQTWRSDSLGFSLSTDIVGKPNSNYISFSDQLKVIIDGKGSVQLSLSQMSSHMMSGKSFGQFSLKTFGDKDDFQLEIFLSFIKGAFKNPPNNIIQYMRDKKIRDILK